MIEMPLGLGIILIILVIGLVGFIIYQNRNFKRESIQNESKINELYDEKYNLQMKNDNLREDLFKLSEARNLLELEVNLTADEKNKLETKLSSLQEEFTNLQLSTSVAAVKNDSKETLEAELENLKALAAQKLLELERISANTKQLTDLQEEKIREIGELDSGIKALEGRIDGGKKVLESIEDQIKVTEVALADLANLKASVLAVEEGAGTS